MKYRDARIRKSDPDGSGRGGGQLPSSDRGRARQVTAHGRGGGATSRESIHSMDQPMAHGPGAMDAEAYWGAE